MMQASMSATFLLLVGFSVAVLELLGRCFLDCSLSVATTTTGDWSMSKRNILTLLLLLTGLASLLLVSMELSLLATWLGSRKLTLFLRSIATGGFGSLATGCESLARLV